MWRNRIQKNGTYRFPLIVEALACLRSRSCIVDGEAVACGNDGIASFDHIRHQRHDAKGHTSWLRCGLGGPSAGCEDCGARLRSASVAH